MFRARRLNLQVSRFSRDRFLFVFRRGFCFRFCFRFACYFFVKLEKLVSVFLWRVWHDGSSVVPLTCPSICLSIRLIQKEKETEKRKL